jgi:leucyl-tRNA synthetase
MVSQFNNPREIQEKWIKRWQEKEIFRANPGEGKKKFFLTVAFPYPSGAIHVGHGRTYTVPDVIARYKRMQGFNVLFPMAWHVTGSPVIGVAERLKRKDEKTLKIYSKLYKVPPDVLETFNQPENIVKYFSESYKENMTKMGYSIDFSREFFSVTPQYSKFIEWQYRKLFSLGLIKKGEHPVRYCPSCKNPVGDHDLMEGETATINEFTVIKFSCNGLILPAATLRPETIFGVTNVWLNPHLTYKKVKVGDETWILSREALEKLKFFGNKKIEVLGDIEGNDLIGKTCIDPILKKEIPILPAEFIDPDYATGVVMSVPAHAPYDYIALKDLKSEIEPITIIDTNRGENPAKQLIEESRIKNQKDMKKLEEATEILYREEHSKGFMKKSIERYGGMSVVKAREKVTEELIDSGKGDIFYEFSQSPVICRCGTKCFIKILKDQWFLKYGDGTWKERTHHCLEKMEIIPPETRENFSYFIDWLKDWACTRRIGLGTKLPWDQKWIIEPLSDSTIYMAYYTISHHLRELNPEKLDDEFFDYILLGKGNGEKVAKNLGIKREKLDEIKEEFFYWYPPEFRLSAKDLVGNHLTFHMFHHTAIFPEEKWPKGIVIFGMGLMEGQKMSSSKGNVVLLEDAIESYGSDTLRLFLMSNAEPWQDFNWQESLLKNTSRKIKQFYDQVNYALSLKDDPKRDNNRNVPLRDIDKWLLSRIHEAVENTQNSLETFQIRKALQYSFFNILNDLVWYSKRVHEKPNPKILREIAHIWVRLMAPFTPFVCEELWSKFNNKGFVSIASYPRADKNKINKKVNAKEEMIKKLIEDIKNILEVTKVRPRKIYLYIASEWKHLLYEKIKLGKTSMKELMEDPNLKTHGKEISAIMKKLKTKDIPEVLLTLDEEYDVLKNAQPFLEREFSSEIKIQREGDDDGVKIYDPKSRAKFSMPMKVGIYVES